MYALLLNEHFLLAPGGSSQRGFVSLRRPRSSRCRLAEPLSCSGCHAQVNPWSPTLKCIGGRPRRAVPRLAPEPAGVSRGRLTPGRTHLGLGLLSSTTDWCNKSLTSLSQTATSQACVGRGGEREGSVGGGWHHSLQNVCLLGAGGGRGEKSGRSTTCFIVTLIDTWSWEAQAKQLGLT